MKSPLRRQHRFAGQLMAERVFWSCDDAFETTRRETEWFRGCGSSLGSRELGRRDVVAGCFARL